MFWHRLEIERYEAYIEQVKEQRLRNGDLQNVWYRDTIRDSKARIAYHQRKIEESTRVLP